MFVYLILALVVATQAKKGKDFFLIGDFAWIPDMSPAYLTFDAMNQIKAEMASPEDDIDFFLSMGDNVYPVNATNPTDDEIDQMLGLFKRDAIKDTPVYAVRGNHDCYYDKNRLLDIEDPQWVFPYFYYTKEVEIGEKGEKMAFMVVDSCLLLCSNFSYGPINSYYDFQTDGYVQESL